MDNFKITKTILENINEQNDRINECVDIVNGYTTDEETRVTQELQRQENELRREEQYNNNENRFNAINTQLDNIKNIQVNVKDFGAVGDGVTDDSLAIINALNTIKDGGTLIFPNGHYMINAVNYKIRPMSNQIFKGCGNSIIQSIHTDTYYHIFDIVNKSNIIIENLILIGDKDSHAPVDTDDSVLGMGIAITGSDNITISNCDISKMWGDGIVLGGYRDIGNKNINILNTNSHNNARQGLSLTFGEDIIIKDSKFNDTDVLLPSCGIDIEPNANQYVKNVVIDNVECKNNREGLAMFCYSADIENLSINNCNISNNREFGLTLAHTDGVTINNCIVEENGDNGCNFSSNNKNVIVNNLTSRNNGKYGLKLTTIGDGAVGGNRATKNITFNNCKFNNNSKAVSGYDGLKIELADKKHTIENIKIVDCQFNDNQSTKTQNIGLNIEKTSNIKNIVINNVSAEGNKTENILFNNTNMVYSRYKKEFEVTGEKIIVTSIDYSTSTFTTTSPLPANNTRLFLTLSSDDGSFPTKNCIPTGLSLNTSSYYIIKVTDNTFKITTTSGGQSINISDSGTVNLSYFHFEYNLSISSFDFSNIGSKNISIEVDGRSPILSKYGYLQINTNISTENIFYDTDSQQKTRPLLCGGNLGVGNVLTNIKINISCEHYLIVNVECFGIVANSQTDSNQVILSKKTYYTDKVKNTLINSVTFRSCELSIGTKVIVS